MSSSKKGLPNGYSAVLNKNSDVEVEILKERYGSLDGLDVPMNGLDILLFINCIDIFSEIILVLLSWLQVTRINASLFQTLSLISLVVNLKIIRSHLVL